MFLQRTPRGDQGNVFDYTSYAAGGRLVALTPPSADGTPTTLFPTADTCVALGMDASCVGQADIQSYDINFNADAIVFSASFGGRYQLYSINVALKDGTVLVSNPKQLTEGGNDFVYPTYLPGGKIMFMSNLNVEQTLDASSTSNQFADEYERATTAQAGTINLDGSGMTMGARNVSHRVSPALLEDGQIVYTEWRHMGMVNDGHLRMMNTDLTGMREAFGGELSSSPSTNSYLKARPVSKTMIADPDGSGNQIANYQMVAIATSRDRTLQAGKLFLINLNGSEAHSTATDLTPLIPGDRTASQAGVGRYYDAEPLGNVGGGPLPGVLVGRPRRVGDAGARGHERAVRHLRVRQQLEVALPNLRRPGDVGRPAAAPARAPGAVQDAGDAGVAAQRGGHDDRRAERLRLVAGRHQGEPDPGQRGEGPLARGLLG